MATPGTLTQELLKGICVVSSECTSQSQNPLEPAGRWEREGQKTLFSDRAGLLWKAGGGVAWLKCGTRQQLDS